MQAMLLTWDDALQANLRDYETKTHNIFICNCYSFVEHCELCLLWQINGVEHCECSSFDYVEGSLGWFL